MKLKNEIEPENMVNDNVDPGIGQTGETDSHFSRIKRLIRAFFKKTLLALVILIILIAIAAYFLLSPSVGKTNLLVLGISGAGHSGSDLTDTIIFISADQQTNKALALSLPRDIWVPELRTKLNSVYHYQGIDGTKKVIGEILGQNINYYLIIDFSIFQRAIDLMGGVKVDVINSFDDYRYPIAGKENDLCNGDPEFKCRYEHLHFGAGPQTMDGETALKYVRSRYAEGEEGSDFSRSLRQQKLLLAVKNKLLSRDFLVHPERIIQLIKLTNSSVKTDYPRRKYLDLLKTASRFRTLEIKTEVLNGDRLINPSPSKKLYDGQWVLIPKSGNWDEIRKYVKYLISNPSLPN